MAFVVETGAGLSNANTYLTDTDADTYFTDHDNPTGWTGATTANKQNALRMATQYLDVVYGPRWKGRKRLSTQSLDWPRTGAVDADDYAIDYESLPQELKDATAETALRHLTETSGLLPDLATTDKQIKSERFKVGPIEEDIEYQGAKATFKKFTIVDKILGPLLTSSGSVGTVIRS